MACIYIVEDDTDIREIETIALRNSGHTVADFDSGRAFFHKVEEKVPDLALLDIMLPDMDGYEIVKKLRSNPGTKRLPVIMVTAKTTEIDMIKGLDIGADDYIKKPFSVMELITRVKAVLRRCHPADTGHVLSAGGLSMDLDCRTVTADGQRLQLTYKEFELLRLFLSHPGMAFTREQLFTQVWNMEYMDDSRTLDMHIRTLRQKLGAYGKLIETGRNVGYRMETGL